MFVREHYSPITTLLRIYLIARAVKPLYYSILIILLCLLSLNKSHNLKYPFVFLSHIDLGGLLLYNKDVLSKYSVFIVDWTKHPKGCLFFIYFSPSSSSVGRLWPVRFLYCFAIFCSSSSSAYKFWELAFSTEVVDIGSNILNGSDKVCLTVLP